MGLKINNCPLEHTRLDIVCSNADNLKKNEYKLLNYVYNSSDFLYNKYIDLLIKKGSNKCNSLVHQRIKLKNVLNDFLCLNGFVYYATFTFNDDKLNDNMFNRSSFVKYLKRNNLKARLYFDYGKINNRVHLHGIIFCPFKLDKNVDYFNKYGFSHFDLITNDNINSIVTYCLKYCVKFNFEKIPRCIVVK